MSLLSQRHRGWQCFLSGTNICLSDEELMSALGANFVICYSPCVICGDVVRVRFCLCVCWCSKPPGLFCKEGPKGKLSSSPLEEVIPPPPFSHTTEGHSQCFGSFAKYIPFPFTAVCPHLLIGVWARGHKAGAWLSPECSLVVTLFPNALQLLLLWPQREGSLADPLGLLLLPWSQMGPQWGSVAPTMANGLTSCFSWAQDP